MDNDLWINFKFKGTKNLSIILHAVLHAKFILKIN